MNNLPLQPLVWDSQNYTQSAFHQYLVRKDGEAGKNSKSQYEVAYGRINTQQGFDVATGFSTIDEAKAWAWKYYNEKMQPYVVPSPTKVYELVFDCDDSYLTVFMTNDKQAALDFMDSVKKHDEQFICDTSYDAYEVETTHELYNDNHPLAPYKDKIFNSIYEDSFSEWALAYVGESFASQLSVIEHELFSTMQNNKGE